MEFALIGGGLLVAVFVLWPALRGGAGEAWVFSEEDTPAGRLLTRKEVLMGNIADLDFEFAMGKLGESDYRSLRENLKRQTLKIMEQLEVVESSETRADRAEAVAAANPTTCTACGKQLPGEAAFCPGCGTKVTA